MNIQQPDELQRRMSERFVELPKVVQDAITSADTEKNLRQLGTKHNLHIDQWGRLENEVMLTLLGFQRPEDLEKNILNEVGVDLSVARALAGDISAIIFKPIREELERQLEHPDAHEATQTDLEAARTQLIGGEQKPQTPPPTPPAPKPDTTVAHMPTSGEYKPGETSTQRASIVDDPYREPPK